MPGESGHERRLSNSSDGSASSVNKHETPEFVSLRGPTATVLPGRPAANPLQFVRVPPAPLTPRARAQLQGNIARPAPRLDAEDWQSNLDSWKSSRRKRVEHIIERCVETRRLEAATQPQHKGKHKTFNEMLEERGSSRRVGALALYLEDEPELNLRSPPSERNGEPSATSDDYAPPTEQSEPDTRPSEPSEHVAPSVPSQNHVASSEHKEEPVDARLNNGVSAMSTRGDAGGGRPRAEGDDAPEYTYEGAIEGYKSRIKHSVAATTAKAPAELQHVLADNLELKLRDLPRVDITKRRELFERDSSREPPASRLKPQPAEIASKPSTRERPRADRDRERLSFLDKVKSSADELDRIKLRTADMSDARSLKERLSSLQSQTSEEEIKILRTEVREVSMSLKERLSCLAAVKNKDAPKSPYEDSLSNTSKSDSYDKEDGSSKCSLGGVEMRGSCRSLDSLDMRGQSSPSSLERAASLEDLDVDGDGDGPTPLSDIETEDSGIHTARDPSDDVADLAQLASPLPTHDHDHDPYPEDNDHDCLTDNVENTDSTSDYQQAVSQPSDADILTEIQLERDDDYTLKSLDDQDTSVSLRDGASSASDREHVVFEGKMTIHLELSSVRPGTGTIHSAITPGDKVAEALEQALEELDSSAPHDIGSAGSPGVADDQPLGDMSLELDALLQPPRVTSPPREKPPPPPPEDDVPTARRIRRELHSKRSSFLGLSEDEGYEHVPPPPPPPDITAFLRTTAHTHCSQPLALALSADGHGGAGGDTDHVLVSRTCNDDADTDGRQTTTMYTSDSALDRRLQESQGARAAEWRAAPACEGAAATGGEVDTHTEEVLRLERELLQLEAEELRRQRDHLLRRVKRPTVSDVTSVIPTTTAATTADIAPSSGTNSHRHSMPNLAGLETAAVAGRSRQCFVSEEHLAARLGPAARAVLNHRDLPMRSSRRPSGGDANVPEYANVKVPPPPAPPRHHHPMTRHTLQTLSAVPPPRPLAGGEWVRRPPHPPAPRHYTNHWLVQEAEARRLAEVRQRQQPLVPPPQLPAAADSHSVGEAEDRVLSVSGRRRCDACGDQLGRGAAMIIESLSLCFHVWCFSCGVCGVRLGDGRGGADVRVRRRQLHCHHCYSSDTGDQYSAV